MPNLKINKQNLNKKNKNTKMKKRYGVVSQTNASVCRHDLKEWK